MNKPIFAIPASTDSVSKPSRRTVLGAGAAGLLLFLAITIAASTLTYRLLEFPMRTRIRELAQRRTAIGPAG